jgi:hypothetical protein
MQRLRVVQRGCPHVYLLTINYMACGTCALPVHATITVQLATTAVGMCRVPVILGSASTDCTCASFVLAGPTAASSYEFPVQQCGHNGT